MNASTRRHALLGLGALALGGCAPQPGVEGGFAGTHPERGHLLRDAAALADLLARPPARQRRVQVLIAGAGVAGLAAARALQLHGVQDFALLDLEDEAGGNARATRLGGLACPLGAHYLPQPSDDAPEVQDLLEELGLRRRVAGRWTYDERHLCHAPRERLFIDGHWQEGLLPQDEPGSRTGQQYQKLEALVQAAARAERFAMPTLRAPITPGIQALAAQSFAHWLDARGLDDARLRGYLDYCCRDDYGAGSATVSAWAGLHYFASRHGFSAPGGSGAEPDDAPVLTWPEGNAWLTRALAVPCGDRLRPACSVLRIEDGRHVVRVDVLNHRDGQRERWEASRCIVALPLHVAARVVSSAPPVLRAAQAAIRHAPWVVANLLLDRPLHEPPGVPLSWDNVVHGTQGLGYVSAAHQSLAPRGETPCVLTWYAALGDTPGTRERLQAEPWTTWHGRILAELSPAHPDLAKRLRALSVTRYGHAMAVPLPGPRTDWPTQTGRLAFAHADWSGYSVFEEAFTRGHLEGRRAARSRL